MTTILQKKANNTNPPPLTNINNNLKPVNYEKSSKQRNRGAFMG